MTSLGLRALSRRPVRVLPLLIPLVVFVVLFSPRSIHAVRKGVLWIKVTDSRSGKPAEGVQVTIKDTSEKILTDKGGECPKNALEWK